MIKILYEDTEVVFCIKPSGVNSEEEMTLKLKKSNFQWRKTFNSG